MVRTRLYSLAVCGLVSTLVVTFAAQLATTPTGYISGVVESSNGPEAGVWVIAETEELDTKLAKIVVTDHSGRFVLPDCCPVLAAGGLERSGSALQETVPPAVGGRHPR